ncbi:gamma-aminobutyric acid type B receptor subunit 2 isoform X2 [Agrilus planipennis]|uniref:Gamma-aminobutyric acid type B receptor subunit 2 n=1 Tax=Agrilus planipennis TaxID=224129 RepID=A0A1W4XAP8_AGRPL|nr:gamma-aminobutyric acid type B receptor subunit 2 isoform X2 [Agrilus planipennis]
MIAQHFYAVLLLFGCLASLITLREKNKNDSRTAFNNDFNLSDEGNTGNNTLNVNELYKYESFFVRNYNESEDETKVRNVYIQGLFEIETKNGTRPEGYSEMLSAQLAIDHINKYKILPGYSLKLLINNTKCDPGIGLDRFFHALYSNNTVIMVLTGSCSTVTEALANVVPYWNVVQISYASKSPILSDRKKFPLFFRTVAVASSHNNARIAFVKQYKWETVAIFSENQEYYLLPLNNFVKDMELANISCSATITFSKENLLEQLTVLKELEVRVIFGSFSSSIAPQVFCEIYNLHMFGSEYVWILQEETNLWWEDANDKLCDKKELLLASDGIFLTSNHNNLSDVVSVYNLTSNDFFAELISYTNITISQYAPLVYDAVWTMAFTLREAIEYYDIQPKDFSYKNHQQLQAFLKIMKKMRFMGISGPVIYKGADRIGSTIFKQLQRGQTNSVAVFDPLSTALNFDCKFCKPVRWKDNQVPVARRILKKRLEAVPKLAFYTISSVSSLGIICSVIFLYFNLHFRRMRTVKLSSPYMNNTAVIGCMTVYLAVTILGMDSSFLPSKDGFTYLCIVETCRSENTLGWFTAMYGYKGILLMMVVYMAWETRRVKIPELNDSQYIGICVYSVLSSTLVIILSNLIPNHPTITYLTTAISILTSTTIIVILLFLPKLKSILARADPIDPIEKSMGLKTEFNTRRFLIDDPKDLIYRLEAQNKVYRNEIQLLDQEITRLENQLTHASSKVSSISGLGGLFLKHKRGSCCEYNTSRTLKTHSGVSRASWPTEVSDVDQTFSQNYSAFSSTGSTLYDQMKRLFGSISLVWHFKADDANSDDSVETKDEFVPLPIPEEEEDGEQRWLFNVTSAVQYSHKDINFAAQTENGGHMSKERY